MQGFFPLFFVLLFLSSMSLPRPLIEQDWFRTIATYNPVSYLIEGVRSLIITGWDGRRWRAASASRRRSPWSAHRRLGRAPCGRGWCAHERASST